MNTLLWVGWHPGLVHEGVPAIQEWPSCSGLGAVTLTARVAWRERAQALGPALGITLEGVSRGRHVEAPDTAVAPGTSVSTWPGHKPGPPRMASWLGL